MSGVYRLPRRPPVRRRPFIPTAPAAGGGTITPPTFSSYAQVANWQATPGTAAVSVTGVSWADTDDIYVIGGTADGATFIGVPTATGLTFTQLAAITPGSGVACSNYLWRAHATSAGGPVTVSSSTISGSQQRGIAVLVVSGSDGPGTPVTGMTGTARSLSLGRVADNSGVLFSNFDWTAENPAPTAWTPAGQTQRTAIGDGVSYGVEIATWGDQGAAGTTSYGQTGTATSGTWSKIAVEIKGAAAAGGTTPVTSSVATTWGVRAQATKTQATTWNVAAQVSKTLVQSWAVKTVVSQTVAQSWAVKTAVAKTLAQSWMVDTGPYLAAAYRVDSAGSDQTTLTTPTFTPAAGEVIVIKAQSQSGDGGAFPTPSGGSLVYTLQQSSVGVANHDRVALWTAVVGGSPSSMAISLGSPGAANNYHSMVVERYTEARLAGTPAIMVATSSSAGAPSGTITTAANDSKVSWLNSDWNAVDGASRAYSTTSATPKETGYRFVSGTATFYWAQQRATTAGSQTIGLTAPTGQNWSLVGIEIQKSTGLISVTNTVAQSWGVRAAITQTLATAWNVGARVTQTLAQSWAVKTVVSQTVAQSWAVRAAISKTVAQSWNVRAAIVQTLVTTWGVGGKVTQTLAQSWAVKTSLSQSVVQSWAVKVAVQKTVAQSWAVRAQATQTLATTWGVGGKVTQTLAQSWAVKTVVSQTVAQSWAVKVAVSKTVAQSWAVRAEATKTVATTWGVGGKVTQALVTTWNVRAVASQSVVQSWAVKVVLSKTVVQSWAVRAQAIKTVATTWNVVGRITATLVQSWVVRGVLSKTVAQSWAVRGVLTKSVVQGWAVRGQVTQTLVTQWLVDQETAYTGALWAVYPNQPTWDIDALESLWGVQIGQNLWTVEPILTEDL